MSEKQPWHGVLVATSLPFNTDLSVDLGAYRDKVRWLADKGCDGIAPNGSLGEYQTLSTAERDAVVEAGAAAAPTGFTVMPGVGAYGAQESKRHAEKAKDAGAQAVMALPPNAYPADERAILQHFEMIAGAGLPVTAYNNPIDTKVDLTPELLAKLSNEGLVVGIKEFSGDVRRCYAVSELAPDLDLMIGTDDTLLEVAIAGAKGWVAGYPQVFPQACIDLYHAAVAGDLDTALPLYRRLHPVLRWDSKPEFIQAIKLGEEMIGQHGGPCRPPRQPLLPTAADTVRNATKACIDAGMK